MPPPACSILVSCYNKRKFVEEAVQSAISQEGADVIVVDDGSTDGSPAALAELLRRCDFLLVCQPNRGAAVARNRALVYADGDLVIYLDGDDLLPPGYVEAHRTVRRGRRRCASYSPFRCLTVAGETVASGYDMHCRQYPSKVELFISFLECGWSPVIHGWVWPREILTECGPWRADVIANDDYDYSARALLLCDDALCCEMVAAIYRQSTMGLSACTRDRGFFLSLIAAADSRRDVGLAMENSTRMRYAIAQWYYWLLLYWCGFRDPKSRKQLLDRVRALRVRTCTAPFLRGTRRAIAKVFGVPFLVRVMLLLARLKSGAGTRRAGI